MRKPTTHRRGLRGSGGVLLGALLAMAAFACTASDPVLDDELALRLIEDRFPDAEVAVDAVRMEQGRGAVEAMFNGAPVQFFFDPPPAAGEGEWTLVEVEHEGSRFAVGDLEQISETMVAMAEIASGLARYQQQTGAFPAGDSSDVLAVLVPEYLPEGTRFVDAWSQAYRYDSTDGTTYTLMSLGPDQTVATRDDIVLHTGEFVERGRA